MRPFNPDSGFQQVSQGVSQTYLIALCLPVMYYDATLLAPLKTVPNLTESFHPTNPKYI